MTALFAIAAFAPLALSLALVAVLFSGMGIAVPTRSDRVALLALTWGSLRVVLGGMLVAVPPGLAIAVLLSELLTTRARRRLKPVAEVLAAVPTVVWGWFALAALSPALARLIPGLAPTSGLVATLAVGLMVLPTFVSLAEDALFAVPVSLREGAYALGADRWTTTWHVVFPAASWGLASAALLAVARAIGESMIVLLAAGGVASLSLDPRAPLLTLPAAIAQTGLQLGPGAPGARQVFVIGAFLLLLVVGLSATSQLLLRRGVIRR